MTLLQRLAAVGLGRRDDELDPRADIRTPGQLPMPADRPALRGAPRPADPRGPDGGADPARRAAPQVDLRGRAAPLPSPPEDDQLDIPAFLRRQANL
jgi:cell division protein FtsZ